MDTHLKNIVNLSRDDMERVNALILENMQSDIPLIPEIASYLISAGGKRLRPMLTCLVARMFGCENPQVPLYATCVEFIHTATLLHDDVIDESDMRRGQDSAHTVWGNQATVLVGDFLFSRAFDLMVQADNTSATKTLSHASCRLAEGEILQLLTTQNMDTTVDMYTDMIKAKTAVLFAAAAKVGAVLSLQDTTTQDALYTYGESLGVAFQMIDDALDYTTDSHAIGKNVGDDFKEGKITLPVLTVLAHCTDTEKAFLHRTIGDKNHKDGDYNTMCDLIQKYDGIHATFDMAKTYGHNAKNALKTLPENDIKTALYHIVDYAIHRAY